MITVNLEEANVMMDVNETYYDNYFAIYTHKSLYSIP